MRKKSVHVLVLFVSISLLLCSNAFSLCYEAAGGNLQSGSIAKYIPSLLSSYETDVPDGALYAVQKKQGYYFKICNEPDQVKHFMKKWAYPDNPNGDWQSILTTANKSKIDVIKGIGVYKVQKEGSQWEVWKYAEKRLKKSKLFVQTVPANTRIRILNIKPKFYQGIEIDPGKYHIEVSADGYEKTRTWIDVIESENKTIMITLDPANIKSQKVKSAEPENLQDELETAVSNWLSEIGSTAYNGMIVIPYPVKKEKLNTKEYYCAAVSKKPGYGWSTLYLNKVNGVMKVLESRPGFFGDKKSIQYYEKLVKEKANDIILSTEKLLSKLGDPIDSDRKINMEIMLTKLKNAMKGNDLSTIESAIDALIKASRN